MTEKSISAKTKQRRARRKKVILAVFNFFKNIYDFWITNATFKKSIILFCLGYTVLFVEWTKRHYEMLGEPYPPELAIAVVTAFIAELALTAMTSIKEKEYRAIVEDNTGDELNYG